VIGPYMASVRVLGQRTAELHVALADRNAPELKPEPFTSLYQRSLYQHIRSSLVQTLELLERRSTQLSDRAAEDARWIVDHRTVLHERLRAVLERKISGLRIRTHGDFHLGQVLYTGNDFVVIDFEGEPARPISERRIKRSPLRDLAGMVRSFHYAAAFALRNERLRTTDVETLARWARYWHTWVSAAFLRSYLESAAHAEFLPRGPNAFEALLEVYLLEKAAYELVYELDRRPDWVEIPLAGLRQLLESAR
jgi:maltose alpha-D-glucosyltransferase / alpha-amylase